jgi:UDP-N-acetylmuramate dehydrogenase
VAVFDAYCELEGALAGTVLLDEPMARHTSFHIGGPAALFIECASIADLSRSLTVILEHGLSWTVVGKGTNLLVADAGFNGAVLTLGAEFKRFNFPEEEHEESLLVAGGGVILSNLVQSTFKSGYSGLEFAVGIPGTLGGAVYMNAGSAQEWIGAIVESVTVFQQNGGLKRYERDDLPWRYRCSGIPLGEIVLECELRVKQGNPGSIRPKMEASLKRRRRNQPLSQPNAGSIFKNPRDDVSAGGLIDKLGLKGFQVGGARVSEMHANFIVNKGSATAADVLAIIKKIRERVEEEYGYELQPEIRFIGFS